VELWSVFAGGKSEKGGRLSLVCSLCAGREGNFLGRDCLRFPVLSVGNFHVLYFAFCFFHLDGS